ncbi:MAG: dynamin family protein [Kofleriaceae bacterium]|nr:dynamin family protein [Kofleriaceae bacterium]
MRAALGEALIADDRAATEEARANLERAAEADDAPAVAFLALGKLALGDGLPATAAEHFRRARDLASAADSPASRTEVLEALIGLGDAALAERDAPGAHQLYLQALQLDPRRAALHARIAAAHRAIGNHDAALASLERAVALGAGPEALRTALDVAVGAGDVGRAVRFANDVLAADPGDPRALVARALGMLDAGQLDAARAMLGLALASTDELSARVVMARLELKASDERAAGKRAADAALAALRQAPADPAVRAVLAAARARELGLDAPGAVDPADIHGICDDLGAALATRADLGHLVGDVARAAADLDTPLLVTVMGEFSSGKSSFVNAFIGHDVAPTGITPTTATINVVRYGRERGGRIIRRDGAVETLAWEPLFERLRGLSDDDARDVDRVEILLPLDHLERINIVDTPGLNSILPEHEATARAFIARSDAVVWLFTAAQGGKASERKALRQIRDEGRRVLGVLNKRDQLSASDEAELIPYLSKELDGLVEVIVPFSARRALAWKDAAGPGAAPDASADDGNWAALIGALEARFFTQARQLKRDACARRLGIVLTSARAVVGAAGQTAGETATRLREAADAVDHRALAFVDDVVARERRALVEASTALYRRAAREVLDLVRPRRLPFGSHSATPADRDYLIALLDDGFATALEASRARVVADLRGDAAAAVAAAGEAAAGLGVDVRGDLHRLGEDRVEIVTAEVYARARAYLRGFLEGGWVESFFRNDLPRLELAEDPTYHALVRSAPDLDREIAVPLARAGVAALEAVARRVEHWAAVADAAAYDLDVGIGRALDGVAARLAT